jgi:hypothetical protein
MASTPFVVNIAVDTIIAALGAFIQPFVGSAQIIQGQQNRVPPPAPDPYVKLTPVLRVLLRTPTVSGVANAQTSITTGMRLDVQVDFYGPTAGDQAAAVETVYRTSYTVEQFTPSVSGIAPLYCTDAHQAPLTNAEQQYEARWTLTASLEYNPVVYIPQQSATKIKVNILEDIL